MKIVFNVSSDTRHDVALIGSSQCVRRTSRPRLTSSERDVH